MHTEVNNVTLVTGLWDIRRSELSQGWNRSFDDHYIPKFIELLKVPYSLIVFGESSLKELVFRYRTEENTQFIERSQDWFKNEFFDKIQEIRKKPEWYNQATWLKDSTQGSLEMYNPLVMSKMFMLNDARLLDKFNSKNLFWIDAGITSTVHIGYFTQDNVIEKLTDYISKFTFVAFPYSADKEIHGFTYPDINKFATQDVKLVGRGGFFGGPKDTIAEANGTYYNLLQETLSEGYMGTEESIFSIMIYKYPEIFSFGEIQGNGLINKFFDDIHNSNVVLKSAKTGKSSPSIDYKRVGLYVITYNSPKQFEQLCLSFEQYDRNFLDLPEKFLLNNSLDRSTDAEYERIKTKYGFKEIQKDNIGICGGRQFIAEHFDQESNLDYYMFFEDDMFCYGGDEEVCRNGFARKVKDLYRKAVQICNKEHFDFLKLNFTEFFGDNQKQWSWHNVPAETRKSLFPEKPIKVGNDTSQAPFLKFNEIKSYKGVPYATGEIYYCNWPQIVSREGNKKMFLDTKWAHPYEQTWMSHFYQLTVNGTLKPGLLLITPTEHNRFEFYPKEERKEN